MTELIDYPGMNERGMLRFARIETIEANLVRHVSLLSEWGPVTLSAARILYLVHSAASRSPFRSARTTSAGQTSPQKATLPGPTLATSTPPSSSDQVRLHGSDPN